MQHAMIDIETMGTKPNAPILSVAAILFDDDGYLGIDFHQHIEWETAFIDRPVNPETVRWWLQQNETARNKLILTNNALPLSTVLLNLSSFLNHNYNVWGNGSIFDIGILENAYTQYKLSPPWNFRQIYDMRTIKLLNLIDASSFTPEIKHDALADAKVQALFVGNALAKLKRLKQERINI